MVTVISSSLLSTRVVHFLVLWSLLHVRISSQDTSQQCGSPAVPLNAKVTLSSDTLVPGTVATYACDEGYELFGSETAVCSATGSWSGELPFCGINVALRRPANQSSNVRGGAAANGNDGEKTTVHDGKRCTETMKESSPWWQVDLLKPYSIKVIRVTTRGCCGHQPMQDLEIRIGNSSSELQRNPLCAWFPGTIEEGVTKTFTCPRTLTGQYVTLQLVGADGSLSVCEVEVFTTDEFSNDKCAPKGISGDAEIASFNRMCYELNIVKGATFDNARASCRRNGGELVHGFKGASMIFLLGELERRRDRLKTQLIWIGAQKEPGYVSRTWRWVDGELVTKPLWGKDQPNNYNGEQNCVVLDGGRNWLWNDVGCNLDYLHWICQHHPSSCGSPDKHVNTTVNVPSKDIGSLAQYNCAEGFMIIGDQNRTCTKEGLWSGHAPVCLFVDCGRLPNIENGIVSYENNRTTFGAVAEYTCRLNHTLVGVQKRICGTGGVWSGSQPQCLFDWCPDPPEITGGLVSISGRKTNSMAIYTCLPGYTLFGQKEMVCSIGGIWSGKPPACKYIDCGMPPVIENGQYNLINGTTTHGSILEYTCNDDYWLEPATHRKQICTREGKWSLEPPSCELITCNEPDVPPGGYVVGYDFNVHSKIEFHCEAGHILKGQQILECTTQGEWNGNPPTCHYIDCGKLPSIQSGVISYPNGSTHLESEAVYSCNPHYRLAGSPVRKCLESQTWSGSAPKCEEIRCPEPALPEHSVISVTGNDRVYGRTLIRTSNDPTSSVMTYKIGALVKYRCERGYKILGDPLSTCEDTGHWSGDVPQCIFVDCGTPEDIEHGSYMLASNVTYYGSAVLYECEPNFELDGHARRLCLENGTWSSEAPFCKEISCKEPDVGINMIVKTTRYSVGGIAQYACVKGQYLEGNSTRECTNKGTWSGKVPNCKPVECEQPRAIENGRVIVMNHSTAYNNAIEYHCVPHYQRIGPYLRKCAEDGKWSGEEPRCELIVANDAEAQTIGFAMNIGVAIIIFLLLVLGLVYLKLKKAKPVKNTENVQGAIKKEEQGTAAMSYSSLSDVNGSNIYENIAENMYDTPYEGLAHHYDSPPDSYSHYDASPMASFKGSSASSNGVNTR